MRQNGAERKSGIVPPLRGAGRDPPRESIRASPCSMASWKPTLEVALISETFAIDKVCSLSALRE